MPTTRGNYEIERKFDPTYLLDKPAKKTKIVLGLDLGTAYSVLALLVLDTTKPIPSQNDLVLPERHIKVTRGFENTSAQWDNKPAGDVPSEIWLHRDWLRAQWRQHKWGYEARDGFVHFDAEDLCRYFENSKSNLSPKIWERLNGVQRRRVKDQIYAFLVCMFRHARNYYASRLNFVDVDAMSAVALTVPCCWTLEVIEIFTDTVYRALRESGLVRSTHPVLEVKPIIINEAEAVATSYLARMDGDPAGVYITMDAGGGTTDSASLRMAVHDERVGTVFVQDKDNSAPSGIDVGSQSLSNAARDLIEHDLIHTHGYEVVRARIAASWVVKTQFEYQKNSILDDDEDAMPFRWNAGGPYTPARGEITVKQKLEIGHRVFDPILELCRDRIENVQKQDWYTSETQVTLVLTGGCFKNKSLQNLVIDAISNELPEVQIEAQTEFSQFVIYGALLRAAQLLRGDKPLDAPGGSGNRTAFTISIGMIRQIPYDRHNDGYNIPKHLTEDESRFGPVDPQSQLPCLQDVIMWFWKEGDKFKKTFTTTSSHVIDLTAVDFIEEKLYMSPIRALDFYRTTDPENSSAKAFETVGFDVAKCVEKGLLRAVVRGKVQGKHYSQQLYEECRPCERQRKRPRRGSAAQVDYWLAEYDLKVENDVVSIKVTAYDRKTPGAELTVEVVPLSAQVGT